MTGSRSIVGSGLEAEVHDLLFAENRILWTGIWTSCGSPVTARISQPTIAPIPIDRVEKVAAFGSLLDDIEWEASVELDSTTPKRSTTG
jgi:hypothetical protein